MNIAEINRHRPYPRSHEELATISLGGEGARAVIAIHSTRLGPAAGGCRLWRSLDEDAAVADALRLSRRASHRHALAELPFGGGQAIILMPRGEREAVFQQFYRAVDSLGGRYIFMEDQASPVAELQAMNAPGRLWPNRYLNGRARGPRRVGMDISRWTALGTFLSIKAALHWWMGKELNESTVAVDDAGPMAAELCRHLARAGAKVVVSDANPDHARILAYMVGAKVARSDEIHRIEADVLAPCMSNRRLNLNHALECRASIICGASQDQLADAETGSALHANAILYCPDSVVSAGGAIGLHYRDAGTIQERISEIPRRLLTILEAAANNRLQPELVAEKMARSRLDYGMRADNHGMRDPAVMEMGGL